MRVDHPTDEKLITRLIASDVEAFKLLYNNNKVMLFANILKFVKDFDTASDILQEVFTEVWRNRSKLDPEKPFKSLLFHVAKNKVYDHFRKASRDIKLQEKLIQSNKDLKYKSLDQEYIATEDIKRLNTEIENLPEKCREVFRLCKLEGRSYQEVSDILNISTATINNHIVKATKLLKERLTDQPLLYKIIFFSFFHL